VFAITFILLNNFIESMGLFDIFKDKDEDENSGGTLKKLLVLNLNLNQKRLLVLNLNLKQQ